MRSSLVRSFGLIVFAMASVASAETFNLTTDTFQLGQWDPKTITYQRGLDKLRVLDRWYNSLPAADRDKHKRDYSLNRNRLFLVAQEKRLAGELESTLKQRLLGASEAETAVRKEKSRQLASMREMSLQLLSKPELLSKKIFMKPADAEKALPDDGSGQRRRATSAFSQSVSKQGGGGSWMSQDMNPYRIPFRAKKTDCKKDDKKCLERVDLFAGFDDDAIDVQNLMEAVFEEKNQSCKSLEVPADSLADELDPRRHPQSSQVLKELGISAPMNFKSNDLSSWYGEPTRQWDEKAGANKASCVGHAIAANLGAALYKKNVVKSQLFNKPVSISADRTYELAKQVQDSQGRAYAAPNSQGYCDVAAYESDPYEGIQSMTKTLKSFQSLPLCTNSAAEATRRKFRVEKFSAAEFSDGPEKPGFAFFKAMIDSGNPPIVAVDSDKRDESAGWFRITSGGKYTHVFNVVGYDEGIDPDSLCPTKYFIVRDSMGKQKIHYKVPAANLLKHLDGVYHITKASEDDGRSGGAASNKAPANASPVTK